MKKQRADDGYYESNLQAYFQTRWLDDPSYRYVRDRDTGVVHIVDHSKPGRFLACASDPRNIFNAWVALGPATCELCCAIHRGGWAP